MDTFRRPSRAQTNQKKAQEQFKRAQEELKKAGDILKKFNIISELEKHIIIALNDISIDDVTDIIEGLKQDITDNLEEFNDVQEDIPGDAENISDNTENISDNAVDTSEDDENIFDNAVDTSEDEYIEVSDNEGPINSSMCDEIIDLEFSNDGQEATKQMIDRINKEQDLYIKGKKGHYSVKKNSKEIIIENHQGEPDSKYDYGLITTIHETNNSIIVKKWEKFGRNQAKRRKFDYKGKNIEEVIQIIHNILD